MIREGHQFAILIGWLMDDLLGLVIGDWRNCRLSIQKHHVHKPRQATSLGHFESYYKKEI